MFNNKNKTTKTVSTVDYGHILVLLCNLLKIQVQSSFASILLLRNNCYLPMSMSIKNLRKLLEMF